MFVCLELDTEDMEIWAQIDTTLTAKFGAVHLLWGWTGKDKPLIPCRLPSNLFYVDIAEKESEFLDRVKPAIESIWSGGYKLVCMHRSWCCWEQPDVTSKPTTMATQEVDIEVDREE